MVEGREKESVYYVNESENTGDLLRMKSFGLGDLEEDGRIKGGYIPWPCMGQSQCMTRGASFSSFPYLVLFSSLFFRSLFGKKKARIATISPFPFCGFLAF